MNTPQTLFFITLAGNPYKGLPASLILSFTGQKKSLPCLNRLKGVSGFSITKVKALTNKKVDVTFKNASDVTDYEIRYSTDKNFRKNVKSYSAWSKSKNVKVK